MKEEGTLKEEHNTLTTQRGEVPVLLKGLQVEEGAESTSHVLPDSHILNSIKELNIHASFK